MTRYKMWQPPDFKHPDSGKLGEIRSLFKGLFQENDDGDLADNIIRYWIKKLESVWVEKSKSIQKKDLKYNPSDPLSRIDQKTVLIAYADSVHEANQPALASLDQFLKLNFPAIGGLHILPACEMSENRFNDGGFSQITRDRIHPPYGSNTQFEKLMEAFFSMTDFVLNHVDMEHPKFQYYLRGDDRAGDCFYVFSEKEYQIHLKKGDFEQIFRPRPFPLFSIFRRTPKGEFSNLTHYQRISVLNSRFEQNGLDPLPIVVLNLLYIFDKIKNDQMLLFSDYQYITAFREYLATTLDINPDQLFIISTSQETQHIPYIFSSSIQSPADLLTILLPFLKIPAEQTRNYVDILLSADAALFGEMIRALTTFSHVQVDVNTGTYEGLKLLIDDFSWYLKMDLNMLRLDAANFAFKKWGTSCFGLPEVGKLMKVLYLSMDAVSPRMVPNLEVNAPLSSILRQMADKQAPPPMMYDFHLASILPVVFNTADASPLKNIVELIGRFDIPHNSIRFSLDESHDGKSVNGSGGADPLLTYSQRMTLTDIVRKNGGYIKYKSTAPRRYPVEEFKKVCRETGIEFSSAVRVLFENASDASDMLRLRKAIQSPSDIARALRMDSDRLKKEAALSFFAEKIFSGKEPYELCISTRDSLKKLDNPVLEVKRYVAFKTLAFALTGRHVKAVYFNDLMGLPNNEALVKKTGELRNIKRTRSERRVLEQLINDPSHMEYWIARQMNHLIALVDADPSFDPRGNEAGVYVHPDSPALACVYVTYEKHHSLILINTSGHVVRTDIRLSDYHLNPEKILVENFTGKTLANDGDKDIIQLEISPFGRYWVKNEAVKIDQHSRQNQNAEAGMKEALLQ